MTRKVLLACDHGEISDPFLLMANDEIFVKPVDLEHYPLYFSDTRHALKSEYGQRVENTRRAVEDAGLPWGFYDGHTPQIIHKAAYREATNKMPQLSDAMPGILCRTPYGCLMASRGAETRFAPNTKRMIQHGSAITPEMFVVSTSCGVPDFIVSGIGGDEHGEPQRYSRENRKFRLVQQQ